MNISLLLLGIYSAKLFTSSFFNVVVSLYANYQDIQNGFSMFDVYTNSSGVAYFGYVNMGNYYVVSTAYIVTGKQIGRAHV